MRLLLDEMFPATLAEQLRARGHDVVSIHDLELAHLEGAPDAEVFATAAASSCAILTENVPDFSRLQADALAHGRSAPALVYTTNRRFPRSEPGTIGPLVRALDALLSETAELPPASFLGRAD